MTRAPFVVHLNRSGTRVKRMTDFAGRLKALLDRPKVQADDYLRQALDDFLGAIYGLALADVQDFTDRAPGTTPEPDKVQIRAEDVANGNVRLDGKWMAGFHFNSALFRLSAVYHLHYRGICHRHRNLQAVGADAVTSIVVG